MKTGRLVNHGGSSTANEVLRLGAVLDGTLRDVIDGASTASALSISTTAAKVTGALSTTGDLTVGATLQIVDANTEIDQYNSGTAYYASTSRLKLGAGGATDPALLIGSAGLFEDYSGRIKFPGALNFNGYFYINVEASRFRGTYNGGVDISAGSAIDAPAYAFKSDTGTGLHWVSAGTFAAVTGSAEIQRWTPDGITINKTLTLAGDATVWDDLTAPATALKFGTSGNPTFNETTGTLDFSASATETIWHSFQFEHTWKEGSTISPHVHWQPSNTDTGSVYWQMEYKWTSIGDTQSGTWTTISVLDPGDGTALKHQIAEFPTIDGTGETMSSALIVKISRVGGDASDTFTGDAQLIFMDIHIEKDTLGSDQEYIK